MSWEAGADLVVVGSGVAGLTAALDATELGLRVVVVTKDAADAGSTRWAQGGVAVVVGDVAGDSVAAHVADTLAAGGWPLRRTRGRRRSWPRGPPRSPGCGPGAPSSTPDPAGGSRGPGRAGTPRSG